VPAGTLVLGPFFFLFLLLLAQCKCVARDTIRPKHKRLLQSAANPIWVDSDLDFNISSRPRID
jgi:hypothetical protein